MMTEYKAALFERVFDRGGATISNARFEACAFVDCALSLTNDPGQRTHVRNVVVQNCSANGCSVGPAILEDVTIDSLSTNDLLIVWGALFKHVVLRGDIGKMKVNVMTSAVDRADDVQRPFAVQREAWYREVDWALDISMARFKEFDARGIPARAFRRDPETQVVVTRERLLRSRWREQIDPEMKLWPFMLKLFEADGDADMVLVAPTGAPRAKRQALVAGLHQLRRLGLAEPD